MMKDKIVACMVIPYSYPQYDCWCVTDGFTKTLDIQGVGYRAAKQGKAINFTLVSLIQ